ncbi:MAG: guanylate kinase [Lachnospiraceae bacterium]|nr:guanylate kinase [Lachnospiraceae bacterium]
MGRLYVFMGKSASGKDTLYRTTMERHPELQAVVSYTTRPIRAGEKEGVEYHFVSVREMKQMEKEGRIVECRCYQTVKGPWYYFTAADGQIDFEKGDFCLISTLEGYGKIRDFYGRDRVVPVYIEVEDFTRMQRSLERERQQEMPCVAEVCRRFLADEEDFSREKLEAAGIGAKEHIKNETISEALCQIEGILKSGR